MPAINTLSDLRSYLKLHLDSTGDFPDNTLDAWIAEGIRFYSAQFPRTWRYTLTLTTGTQAYALPATHGFQRVLSVEYPTAQTPQSFLREVQEQDDAFQNDEDVYAIRGITDTTVIESDTAQGYIVFAETVTTGQYAVITYLASHPIPVAADNDAQITVPLHHWEAITAFVDFMARWSLEAQQAIDLGTTSIQLAQMGQESRMAWNRYKDIMDRLAWTDSGQSVILPWNTARIY